MQGNGRAYGKGARRLWGKYAAPPPRAEIGETIILGGTRHDWGADQR